MRAFTAWKNCFRRAGTIFLVLAFLLSSVHLPVFAAETVVASGNCGINGGDKLKYTLYNIGDDQYKLTITGSGYMGYWDVGSESYPPWYDYARKITTLELPDGLTSIGSCAFFDCSSLALTSLPSGLTSIGDYAFKDCSNLALTSLPDGLTSIEYSTFDGCDNLALTSLPEGITAIEGHAFRGCDNLALTSLPDGLTSIGNSAFSGCSNLALTSLPEGITSIGSSAFHDCSNLALTSLPSGITSIGSSAFKGCSNLALTSLPSGLTSIGEYAFSDCSKLALTSLPDGLTSIGDSAFRECSNLALTGLPDGLTSIEDGAFYECSNLALTSLPSGLTSIGEYAFRNCSKLALTSLPDGITSIGHFAFYRCSNLALTGLPDCITSIGKSAFEGCTGMELTTLPNAKVSVGSRAFNGVSWLVPENHYLQNTDGSYPATPSEVTTQLVKTGYSTKRTTKTFPGFTLDETALPAQVTVPLKGVPYGDTTIKLDYYYTRNAYDVVWKNTDGRVLHTDKNVFYGARLTQPELTAPAGYTFTGWSPTVPETMPDKALEVTAVFVPNEDTPYRVEHHQENVTGSGYTLADTENGTGTTDTTATATAKSYTGFTENKTHTDRITSGNIHGDGSLTLKLYYDRNRHNITWRNDDGSVYHTSESVAYGMLIEPPNDPAKRGYTFTGWSPTVPDTMTDEALEFTATFTANEYPVTITSADGGTASADCGNEAATDSTVSVSATADNVHAFIGWAVLSGDVTLADPTAESTTFVMPPEGVSIRAEFKGQIGVDTDGDGIPDTKIDANDKGEGKDTAAGDGIYTDDNGKKYEEQSKGSGTFVEVTDDYISVDTDGDGKVDTEVKANDMGEGKDTAAGDGIYTDDDGKKYEEQPKGSGIFVEVTDDCIPVDTNCDGKADIEVKANDKGEGKDTVADDGIYTDESGKKYKDLDGDGIFVEVTDDYISVDTDSDGRADIEVKANDKGDGKDLAAGDGIYTDDSGKKYEEQPKDSGIFVDVTDKFIGVDTDGDGIPDTEVDANDKGEGKDTVADDGIYTDESGKKYKDLDGDGIFVEVTDEFIGVDTDGDGIPDTEVDANDKGEGKDLAASDGVYTDTNGEKYIESAPGSGVFAPATGDYIQVDTDGDGQPDTEVKANDNGNEPDLVSGDGIYTDKDGNKYEEQPEGSGTFIEVTGDYIKVDTNKDGIPDTEVKANDRGEGKDLAAGDGIYTDESGKKYEEQPKDSGIFVDVTDKFIGVDTDGDGIPDTEVDANDKGDGKDLAAGDGIYTDDSGKKYEEQPKDSGIFVEVTGDYIQVDTNKDGIPDIEVKANDRGEGKDLVSGDGIYTDGSGRKFIESTSGSGVFVEVTGDYIQVDTNKDGIPDIEVKANDKGEGKDKKAGDGIYTDESGKKYEEQPAGSGVYEKKKDDTALSYTPDPTVEYVYIQVDTNLDGVADINVMVNDAGLDNDVAKGDGVYTSPSGIEYVAHPTVAGLYIVKGSFVVDQNEGKIGVDTDGDGKPDTWVDAKDDGIAPDLVYNDKLFTDEDGKLYIEVADKLYKEVTSEYIKVDTDGDGKADIMVKANDNGIDGDITINDGIYTTSDGVIYHDPDGDGVFTQASQSDFDAAQKYPADIVGDEWYSEEVVTVVENGIIETYEDRTFKANYVLTRSAAVYAFAVLNDAELSSRYEILRIYNDVDATTQYATAIEWAAEINLVLGYGDGSFGPEDPITREQLIAILHRQYSNVINEPSADIDEFNDADEVSEWALEYMRWAVGNDIVHGDDLGNLNPLQNVTRAEAATIITRITARDGIGN